MPGLRLSSPRAGHAAVVVRWTYQADGGLGAPDHSSSVGPRFSSSLMAWGNRLWVFGGWNPSTTPQQVLASREVADVAAAGTVSFTASGTLAEPR